MHFHSLAVLRIPQVEEDPEETARVVNELTSLELMEEIGPKNIMRQIFIRELKGQLIMPNKRAVLLLSFFMDYRDSDIARTLRITNSTVSYRKKQALKQLKVLLEGKTDV